MKHGSKRLNPGIVGAVVREIGPVGLMTCFLSLVGVVVLVNFVTDNVTLAPLQIEADQSEAAR